MQAVKAAFPQVVRTTGHLAAFFGYWKNLALHPVDAGDPPLQAVDGLAAVLGYRGVLPDRRETFNVASFLGCLKCGVQATGGNAAGQLP